MATNIPPHNLGEICDAIIKLVDEPDADDDAIIEIVKGPDFPTGGMLLGREAIRTAYKTGRGSVAVRGRAEIIEEKGKYRIEISELPYQITIERVMQSIKEAYQEKRITGISDLNDLSNRHGMKIVVDLQRTAVPNVVLNQLYKQTPLQSSFAFNMLALVPVLNRDGSIQTDGNPLEPQVLSLREILNHFIAHRKIVVTRRTQYDLRKAEERAHLLEGFRIALDNIDEVIKIVRESQTVEIARNSLSARFGLSEIQAAAIVDMRLRTLTGLERQKIEDEYNALQVTIADLKAILGSVTRLLGVVRTETEDLKKRLGDARKTPVEALEGELSIEDIIEDTEVVVTVTVGGYIKRVSVDTFRAQNRGGRGVTGIANLKKEDVVQEFFVATTHQHVLFFTNKGRAFRLRAYEVPDSSRQARGTALVNLLTLPPGENVSAVFPVRNFDTEEYLVMVTKKGVIKKTKLDEFANVRRNGLIAIGLDDDDELLGVALSTGERDIIMATHDGMAVHFNEKGVRPMGRPARGVRAITLAPGDSVVAMDIVDDDRREVLIVTSQAFGKRTDIEQYRHTSRGGKGVKAFAKEKEIGHVVDQILVNDQDELLMMTSANQVIRIRVSEIRRAGRSTKGVRLQRLAPGDEVIAIANLGQLTKRVSDVTGEATELS
jgi:DNA gyrase subunit A